MNKILKIINALSSKTRLKIFLVLSKGQMCVCELEEILSMKQSRISHALRKLSEANIVKSQREGKWIIYSLNPEVMDSGLIRGLLEDAEISGELIKRMEKCKKEGIRKIKCK